MKKTFLGLFLLVQATVFAQLAVTFPVNRAVFQRSRLNTGLIPIAGTFQARVEKVEARLIPINGGRAVDWTVIAANPSFGTYIGGLYAQAGWYKLEVRGLLNGNLVGASGIEKVGVGEVFVISGQSNAQGYENRGNPAAADDRVNCIINFHSYGQITEPPFPIIAQMTENVKIAPFGNGSWCWGKLGDLLVEKLNVPILFINTGFEAMGIEAWSKSADGERGKDFYSGNFALPGYPFENLRKSLHYYGNMFGVRSVLWHQGETDNDKRTTTENYKRELENIIYRSRGDTGKDLSWMIARVSRVKTGTYQPVIDGQNQVIQSVLNVFEGPNTDLIGERTDGVHFFGNGLVELARAWNSKLDLSFFEKSNPIPPSSPLFFDLKCNAENAQKPLKIFMPNGFKDYYWTNGLNDIAKNVSLETNLGFYRGRAIDFLGNVYYTPLANYTSLSTTNKPTIEAEGSTSFCQGGSVKLTSNVAQDIFWNTGENFKSIIVRQKGTYTASQVNYLGCFVASNAISVDILPKPEITISTEGDTAFCADKSLKLTANITSNLVWNNGEVKPSIMVNKSGEYFATAKNEFGCESVSPKIRVSVNPLPEKPIVTADGATVFCADKTLKLNSSVGSNITWNTGEKTPSLIVSKSGDYSVMARNEFGCQNFSNVIPVSVSPIPAKPVITANGPTLFCDGQSVTLAVSENKSYQWSNSKTTKEQTINSSGFYSAKVIDQNGCVSPPSTEIEVIVKPAPLGINILQSSTFTLEAITNGFYDFKFEWYKDKILLPATSNVIKAKADGAYSVKGSVVYQLGGGQTLRCFSAPSVPYKFEIDPALKGVSIFPNPAPKSIINIETQEDLKDVIIQFYDLRGVNVGTFCVDNFDTRQTLDLSRMPKGNFLILVKAKDFKVVKRVFIE